MVRSAKIMNEEFWIFLIWAMWNSNERQRRYHVLIGQSNIFTCPIQFLISNLEYQSQRHKIRVTLRFVSLLKFWFWLSFLIYGRLDIFWCVSNFLTFKKFNLQTLYTTVQSICLKVTLPYLAQQTAVSKIVKYAEIFAIFFHRSIFLLKKFEWHILQYSTPKFVTILNSNFWK